MTWAGIPYAAGGESRSGADCWGLVRLYAREELGVVLPDIGRDGDAWHLAAGQVADTGWQKVTSFSRHGDVLLFRLPGAILHVGVMLPDGRFLHVMEGGSSRIDLLAHDPWRSLLIGVYRWTG